MASSGYSALNVDLWGLQRNCAVLGLYSKLGVDATKTEVHAARTAGEANRHLDHHVGKKLWELLAIGSSSWAKDVTEVQRYGEFVREETLQWKSSICIHHISSPIIALFLMISHTT